MTPPTTTARNELPVRIREKTEELAAAQRILNSAGAELGRNPSNQGALDRLRAAQGPVNTINDELAALAEISDAAIAFDLSLMAKRYGCDAPSTWTKTRRQCGHWNAWPPGSMT
jgi:hypothetical protein